MPARDVKTSRLVFSTETGKVRDSPSGRAAAPTPGAARLPQDGVIRIFRERAGRRGKIVTVIRGLPDRGPALDARAAALKRLCGGGGTVKGDTLEIQGDHRERVAEHLRGLGHTVKLAGG
ncbi:MAG TPA: stress response translation initiation inhibitor YciH [Methylomirabilota bacterium]|jgi:translation initiation factor 1|nr:stress response translation initiation inhibitor YciH [Methylomirabilota bacterium]